ncbi:MAG: nitroreductase family protein [Nitrososphaerota archaeon]|nr:nitroreductase family protein [Candidatus Calditenuaceae archaeon]MDW8073699.1 nitroreductase family protein [Nitrososphaerota archaeon]
MSAARQKRKRGVLALIFRRRSIRVFRDARPSRDVLELLVEAGQRAPIVYQSFTVICITRPELRARIYELTEDNIIKQAPIILLLCVDMRRTKMLFDLLEPRNILERPPNPIETVEAIFEAGLFAENLTLAGEAIGYSSVILDWPLKLGSELQDLLQLPAGVAPLFFICMGPPGENPPIRPRMPLDLILMFDRYVEPKKEQLLRYLEEASEKLAAEGYLLKYVGTRSTYMEYLAEKVRSGREVEALEAETSEFLRRNGLTI